MSRIFFLRTTVFRLSLDDRIIEDADGDTDFHVRVDLIGIPTLIIGANESLESNEYCESKFSDHLEYWAARTCHFVAEWTKIVDGLKRKPLKIGVYRADERFPVCHGVLPFSGCVCDLVSQAMQESSPFELSGDFNLIDPGGNPAGRISLAIVLVDLGRHVIASFALDRDRFVMKNDEGVEYACESKNSTDRDRQDENVSPLTIDDRSSHDCGREKFMHAAIFLAAANLSRGKEEVEKARRSLRDERPRSDETDVKSDGDGVGKKKLLAKKSRKKKK